MRPKNWTSVEPVAIAIGLLKNSPAYSQTIVG